MFDLHIFSRFLRLVRSIRRSLLAFFVAIAMLLATFVIAPAYALSAGEGTGASVDGKANTEQTEGAKASGAGGAKASGVKSDGAKADGAQKQGVQQSEPNKTESDKKNTESSSNLKKNKESKPDSKQHPASNNGVDKAKSSDSDVKKNVKKQDVDSAKDNGNSTDRVANEEPQLPKECKAASTYW